MTIMMDMHSVFARFHELGKRAVFFLGGAVWWECMEEWMARWVDTNDK